MLLCVFQCPVFQSQNGNLLIPPEEIENAMKAIAQYALGISPESLIAETAKVFGFSHVGEKSRKRFFDIYKRMLWEKKLFCDNDLVTVA